MNTAELERCTLSCRHWAIFLISVGKHELIDCKRCKSRRFHWPECTSCTKLGNQSDASSSPLVLNLLVKWAHETRQDEKHINRTHHTLQRNIRNPTTNVYNGYHGGEVPKNLQHMLVVGISKYAAHRHGATRATMEQNMSVNIQNTCSLLLIHALPILYCMHHLQWRFVFAQSPGKKGNPKRAKNNNQRHRIWDSNEVEWKETVGRLVYLWRK